DNLVAPDTAHTPANPGILGLITGERRWLAAGVSQAAWHLGNQNPGRRAIQPIWSFNARILWWGMRDLFIGWLCAKELGWTDHITEYGRALDLMASWMMIEKELPHLKHAGIIDADYGQDLPNWMTCAVTSPWQADMGVGVVAWMVKYGLRQYDPVLDHLLVGLRLRFQAYVWVEQTYGIPVGTNYRLPISSSYIEGKSKTEVGSFVYPKNQSEVLDVFKAFLAATEKESWSWGTFNDWSAQTLCAAIMARNAGKNVADIVDAYTASRAYYLGKNPGLKVYQQYAIVDEAA
ncbi:MAG: hypothetical protein LPL29_13415, partial [Alphaproteobacteria bacterium]|nr:hypothetical protein [Alphaproteobacteria bacterium]